MWGNDPVSSIPRTWVEGLSRLLESAVFVLRLGLQPAGTFFPSCVPLTEKAARSVCFRAVTQTSSSHATHHGAVSHTGARGSWTNDLLGGSCPHPSRLLWASGQAQSSFELIGHLDVIETKVDIPQKV